MAQVRARVWLSGDRRFPEEELPEVMSRRSAALCLSGGGSRATCAAAGYLRALHHLGLMDRLRYTSAVSGGSWASIPYTFGDASPGAPHDDVLGPIAPPEALSMERLEVTVPRGTLGYGATQSVRDGFFEELFAMKGPGAAWNSVVAELFLGSVDIFDPKRPRTYTWSEQTRDEILARQAELPGAKLRAEDFLVAAPNRPFPVVNACLLGPAVNGRLARLEPIGFQLTPLYVGCPPSLDVTFSYKDGQALRRRVGGGLIEPFAFDGAGPGWLAEDSDQVVTLERPASLSHLGFMIGTSSCAFGSVLAKFLGVPYRVPTARYWPQRPGDVPTSANWEFGDGGFIDNYGLHAMLQRDVETLIVLVNTAQKLDLEWDPSCGGSYREKIDDYLPPLFGVSEEVDAIATHRNQVFPTEELAPVVRALQEAKRRGDPLIAVGEHRVLDNEWWGVRGGRHVRVAWVYLDRVPRFEQRLPSKTRTLVNMGNLPVKVPGPFQGFPNYATISANAFSITRLRPEQARLLTEFTSWVVLDQRQTFESLLR